MNKKFSNRKLHDLLGADALRPGQQPMPKDEFWEAFRARAALTHQEQPEAVEARPGVSPWVRWRWVAPALAAVAIAVFGVWNRSLSPGDTGGLVADSGEGEALSTEQLCEVREVEVFVDYTSVMIMQDEENGGTILLLADAGGDPLG